MKLFLGIIGKEVERYRNKFMEIASGPYLDYPNILVANWISVPIQYPPLIKWNEKALLMNGVFILRNTSLDVFIDDPAAVLTKILRKPACEIPHEFVNGAYNGLIREKDDVYLFNDFMALDPLYYFCERETLFFSNRIKPLNQLLNRSWNRSAINEYLTLGYNFSYETLLAGVRCLPPASLLCFRNGQLSIINYTSFPKEPERNATQQEIVDHVHQEFIRAIRRIYSPRKKFKLSLTGGMDSRLIYFEWPDRQSLMTETAGVGTSDYIKASALTRKLGNPCLHELEDMKEEQYTDGIEKFYAACDNPSKLLDEYNYHHLSWKIDRGADFHLSGVGGELINGESLYISRHPLYVLREAFLPYSYIELKNNDKRKYIERVVYSKYKIGPKEIIADGYSDQVTDYVQAVVNILDRFIGAPKFVQSYVERFRTLMLANASFYPLDVLSRGSEFLLMPFNDSELINTTSRYHPYSRELRRLELAMIQKYELALEIPLDSSHLLQNRPYAAHKFMRTLRMVFNIGMHKKLPLIQEGEAPKFRAFKYFDSSSKDFREFINKTILNSGFYDKKKVNNYLNEVERTHNYNFYTSHREAVNLMLLFRLAYMEKKV